MSVSESTDDQQHHQAQRSAVLLIVALAIITGAIAWYGVRRPADAFVPYPDGVSDVDTGVATPVDVVPATFAVAAITLPHFEPMMPPGPHRDVFMTNCITCHSPRLVTDQPHFPRKKWEEVVHKMAETFGGHLAEDDRPKIVDYLVSIRGTTQQTQPKRTGP